MAKNVSSESSPPQKKTKGVSLSLSSAPPHQDPPAPRKSLADLPDDLLENVFTFLPIKNAVNACTVSTKFKRSWTLNRKFMFGREFARHNNPQRLVAFIDHIFDSHKGPEIQCFHLHINPENIEPLIEKWLKLCIAKGLQELELNFYQRGFILASDFLEVQTLKILRLYNCAIVLPPVMTCFKNLHTVVLKQLELTEEMLEKLLFYCKMIAYLDLANCSNLKRLNIGASKHNKHLKTLKISCCHEVQRIEIDAPTLRCFHYRGAMMKIQFAQVVKLNEAIFSYMPTKNYLEPSYVESLINHLADARVLTTTALFQEALTARVRNGVFQEPQFSFGKLRELQLFMEGGMFINPYDVAVFIKNCPSLERLFIDLTDYNFECGMIWNIHHKPLLDSFNHYFDRLRVVRLKSFKFSQSELELLKILIQKSRFLEYVILITPKSGRTKLHASNTLDYRKLIKTWQATPRVRVDLYPHSNDKSGVFPSHTKYWH